MNIAPKILNNGNGPFGAVYPGDQGYTAEEWATIPPVPPSLTEVTTKMLDEMINTLLLESDIRSISNVLMDVFLILSHGYEWDGHSCQREALNNHLTPAQIAKWDRLDFEAIWKTFPPKSEEDRKETCDFFKEIGEPVTSRWLHNVGSAQWWRCGSLGSWSVRNPL